MLSSFYSKLSSISAFGTPRPIIRFSTNVGYRKLPRIAECYFCFQARYPGLVVISQVCFKGNRVFKHGVHMCLHIINHYLFTNRPEFLQMVSIFLSFILVMNSLGFISISLCIVYQWYWYNVIKWLLTQCSSVNSRL